jgi:hydrogenase expression/formation protein HypC
MKWCEGERCVVCSDQVVAATVVALLADDMALIEVDGVHDEVSVALVDASVGDEVLVHAREALTVVSPG